ncbi:unnamed protein product [Symbiodinium natans]|uniref:RRM domain-containing protein n=1 Tax=Symbiodinium natans TaxID=878477 RepID=A0A812S5C2_9DINO|nr:unnamed protein product [Symbiodinium natans]
MSRGARSLSPRTPRTPRRGRGVPPLVSRQCGNLMVFVADRSRPQDAEIESPKSPGTAASPRTPAFKPQNPSRLPVVLKAAVDAAKDGPPEQKLQQEQQDVNMETEVVMEVEKDPCATKCEPEASEAGRAIARQDQEAGDNLQREDEASNCKDSCTEISSPGSASPCSSANSSCESTDETEDDGPRPWHSGLPGIGFFPMCAPMFPSFRHKAWQHCHGWQVDNLKAWYHVARQRAQLRGAPKADETCAVGCCCRRCIGFPAAFRPKNVVEATDAEDAPQYDASDTESSSSAESSDDVQVVFPKASAPCPPRNWHAPVLRRGYRPTQATEGERKVFCCNLSPDGTAAELQQAFELRFRALPLYQERYLAMGMAASAVRRVAIRGGGTYAFVTFFDEQLASTAMLFHGMEFCGQKVRTSRPTDFVPAPDGAVPPMDVGPLRRLGMLPQEDGDGAHLSMLPPPPKVMMPPPPAAPAPLTETPPPGATTKAAPPAPPQSLQSMRHLYLGNLPPSEDTLQDVTEMITCICSGLPAYDPNFGPAMLGAEAANGGGWLVEMQSPELARQAQGHLCGAIFQGQSITAYVTFGQLTTARAGG